ncbi:MAG: acetyl-CoA acetyltransferase [Actinomycetota bacterium]
MTAVTDIHILGVHQTDFARNTGREGATIADLVRDTVTATLEAAALGTDAIETIHVGNAFGLSYTGQAHLGAMPATVIDGLWGVPAMRHEGACASSSLAALAAMAELEAGRYDCALVLGVEIEKSVPGADAAAIQAGAAFVGHEAEAREVVWPAMFDRIADEYDARFGVDDAHLRAIGRLNLENAQANPLAQTRQWSLDPRSFEADDVANPVVDGRLRRNDCCQITDGGAGVVLVTDRWLARHGRRPLARIAGWGHRTVGLALEPKLTRSAGEPYVLPHVRQTITDAFARAGIADATALDGIETHDCMTPSEYMAIDHFGLTAPGESWKAIEDGVIERDGALPFNAGGGLIGGGHPVGATGARMLADATKQVTDAAGDYQIEGARRMATLNIGGSTATTVSFVVEAAEES